MKRMLVLLAVLWTTYVNAQNTPPVLSNFRIENNQPSRVYFDSSMPVSGTSTNGFKISGKTISGINLASNSTSGHYLTVSAPFTFWDNNTVKYDGGNNIKDKDGLGVTEFTLTYIENKIREPESSERIFYVNAGKSTSGDGSSESKAFKTLGEAIKSTKLLVSAAGTTIYVKAGLYRKETIIDFESGSVHKPIKIIGYKNSINDITKNYFNYIPRSDLKLDASEMPVFDGENRGGDVFFNIMNNSYLIFKNIQFTNYAAVFRTASMNGFVAERLNMKNIGSIDDNKGIAFKFEGQSSNNGKIIDCRVVNATSNGVLINGRGWLVDNTKVYCNEAVNGPDDIDSTTDYYYIIQGSNNIIRNSLAYKDTPNGDGHLGHGFSMKGVSGSVCENNLIDNCTAIGVLGSFQTRHPETKNNVIKNSEAHAAIPNRRVSSNGDVTAGIEFLSGGSYNIYENMYIHDIDIGINNQQNSENSTNVIASNNIIRNSVFNRLKYGINYDNANNSGAEVNNLKVYNNTFYDLGQLHRVKITRGNIVIKGNEFKNNIFSKVSRDNEISKSPVTGWIYEYNNFNKSFSMPAGLGNIDQDPKFTDENSGNFRLKPDSPVIDKGKMIEGLRSDFDGKARPSGKAIDIGAFEYQDKTTSAIKADAGEDQTICIGTSTTLTASGGSGYKWSTGATTKSITVSPTATTTYSVTVSEGSNSDTDEVIVTVNPLPTANAGADVAITSGQSTTLTALGGDTYLWSNGATTASIIVKPLATTVYEVTVTKGGCSATDKVKVTVNPAAPPPTVTVKADAGKDQTICIGTSTTLTASGGSGYKWSTGATTKSITVSPTATTTYSVTVSEGSSSDTDEVLVTVNELPVADAGTNKTIEQGQSTTLIATGGDTYLWSSGETTASITVNPAATATYEVTVTKNGCSSTDTVTVTVNAATAPPVTVTADAGEDQTICIGTSTTLTASGGSGYKWSTGATTKSITVSPTATTTYSVTVSEGSSSDTDEVLVTVNELPVADAGTNKTIEQGQSTTLIATGGDTYLWSSGETTASITVNPAATATYEVTVTKNGCSSTDTVTVTVNAATAPPVTVTADAGEDQTICIGASTTLTASGGLGYKWSTGATTKSITVSPTATTTYSVTVSEGSNSDTDEVILTVNPFPTANAGADVAITSGQSTTLTALGGDTYLWSNGATTASITVSPTATTTYEVTVTKNGCNSTDAVTVTVNAAAPPPTVTVKADAGKDQTICAGTSTTLTATGGSGYKWSTGATTKSITVSPAATTTYSVTVSEGSNSDTDEVIVMVNDVPVADAGTNKTIEQGQSTTLAATGGGSYLWSTGETSQSITVQPTQSTIYSVTVSQNGCSSMDNVQVGVTIPPPANANAGNDLTICKGESITLKGDGGATYTWSNGANTQNITVSPNRTTTYTLTANRGGTTSTDEVIVTVINCNLNNGVNNSVSSATSGNPTKTPESESDEQVLNKADFELTVYPNPTEGRINVQTTVPIYNFNLVLMNINGHVIYSDEMDANEDGINKEIDLSRFAKGVYLLQLYNENESFVKKVMVI